MFLLDFNIAISFNQIFHEFNVTSSINDIQTVGKSNEVKILISKKEKMQLFFWSPVDFISNIVYVLIDKNLSKYLKNFTFNIISLFSILFVLLLLILFILSTALLTLKERSILASVQLRKGPDKIAYGFLQPIADALKLILKEFVIPNKSFKHIYNNIASFGFVCSTFLLVFIPFSYSFLLSNSEFNFLFIFFFNLLHVYAVLLSGWSSKSKYSSLGAVRSISQLISYDIALSLIIMHLYCYAKTFSVLYIMEYQALNFLFYIVIPLQAIYFVIIGAAETSRHPFDLPEAEPELVSGYNVEYSAIRFALFFLSEYLSVILFSCITISIFFNGWSCYLYYQNFEYALKISIITFVIIKLRAILPRYRVDQLMRVCWKFIIPFELLSLIFSIALSFISI